MIVAATRHPQGLYVLFFTEMWERFSYYGMRALLVLYLVNALDYPRADALALYATYTALVYLTPVIGGYLADRWLGSRQAVFIGAILMALGHFAMAIPTLLHIALGLLIAGNGFFKPNISTMVGSLYADRDVRRDSGFTIFYMGINLGAFLAPIVCGTLGEKIGWHYGFAAAGVGMVSGLLIFLAGQRLLGDRGMPPRHSVNENGLTIRNWATISATCLVTAIAVFLMVTFGINGREWWQSLGTVYQIGAGLILFVGALAWPRTRGSAGGVGKNATLSRQERHRIIAIMIMAVFVVSFWMGFEQAGGTMNLFADKQTDRLLMDWEMPASYFQAVNPLLILLLAPLFSLLWVRLDKSRFALSTITKQAIGMLILGTGFIVLAIAQERADLIGKVGPGWLFLVYFLHTTGELCLSPIGLSMVTKLAPTRFVSLMMGLWFSAMALASFLAGTLESILAGSGIPLYWFLVASSIGAGLMLLILSPLITKLMHGHA